MLVVVLFRLLFVFIIGTFELLGLFVRVVFYVLSLGWLAEFSCW